MNNLKNYFSYNKFINDSYKILYLNKSYFLQNEIIQCLRNLGHSVFELKVVNNAKTMLENLLQSCVEFKPDFIFGTNHIGLDEEGQIAQILNNLCIPVVFWYLDDYRFIIKNNKQVIYPNTLIFTFEKNNISSLKKLGFEHVFFMPSATFLDPTKNYSNKSYNYLNNSLSFVGNTFEETKNNWYQRNFSDLVSNLNVDDFFDSKTLYVVEYTKKQQSEFQLENEFLKYCGYVSAHFTQLNRVKILKYLIENFTDLHIFGDEKWTDLIPNAHISSPVDNIKIAPHIYSESQINLNISSAQLETAVNLRVFDIPAAGGFLLSDWKENLETLFETEKEIIIYRSKDELVDKIKYYRENKIQRDLIVESAKNRIHKDHLLQNRVSQILSIVKKRAKDIF